MPTGKLQKILVEYGVNEDEEDCLIGTRDGLLLLKDYIDKALQDGACEVPDEGIDFISIRVTEPRPKEEYQETWKDKSFSFGCLGTIFLVLALAIYGAVKLAS